MAILTNWALEGWERWQKAWRNELRNCQNCDFDYTKDQIIEVNNEKSCPNCKEPDLENAKLYYCIDHGWTKCNECGHNDR